jgi:hypothetical protein
MEPGRLVACSSCLSLSVHQKTKWTLKSSPEISTTGYMADAYLCSTIFRLAASASPLSSEVRGSLRDDADRRSVARQDVWGCFPSGSASTAIEGSVDGTEFLATEFHELSPSSFLMWVGTGFCFGVCSF